jgi:peptidoglycan hydrolase CwlO-like protein
MLSYSCYLDFTTKFNTIYEKLFNNLQNKVQTSNDDVQALLSKIHQEHVRNSQLKKKLNAIQAQTAFLHNNINGTEGEDEDA